MERLTRQLDKNYFVTNENAINHTKDGYSGEAINRLAKFENVYENLIKSQEETITKMESLRKEGKTNTVTFKQLMAKKLTNDNFINLLKLYDLE